MNLPANNILSEIEPGEMEMRECYFSFGEGKEVLDNVTFKVEKGSFTCLCGPSGCGKTSIINLLAGYAVPDMGECLIDGVPVHGPGRDRLVVFQETALLPWMTLWENTIYGPRVQGKDLMGEVADRAEELINMVGLTGFEEKYPSQLSGGMQRRAELVRALINQPKVLLMDEPFRGLDAMTRAIMQEYIIKLFEQTGTTILFVTAELEEAIFVGDVAYFLTAGPARVKKELKINLPRPRKFEHLTSPEFVELQREAIETVDEEAQKAFSAFLKAKEKVVRQNA
ncbi:MAG: ABC transporter ATP-binding protein [Syntrophobacteraceae bacterium]